MLAQMRRTFVAAVHREKDDPPPGVARASRPPAGRRRSARWCRRGATISTTSALMRARSSIVSTPRRPRWSACTFSTAPTSQRSKPSPSRKMPPRAVSSTAASTRRVFEHHPRAPRAGHIATHIQLAVDINAVGGGQADALAVQLQDMRDHARGGGFAVGAGDGDDRDTRMACRAGNSISITGRATLRGVPSDGCRCIRKPGPALTSTMPPPVSRSD